MIQLKGKSTLPAARWQKLRQEYNHEAQELCTLSLPKPPPSNFPPWTLRLIHLVNYLRYLSPILDESSSSYQNIVLNSCLVPPPRWPDCRCSQHPHRRLPMQPPESDKVKMQVLKKMSRMQHLLWCRKQWFGILETHVGKVVGEWWSGCRRQT